MKRLIGITAAMALMSVMPLAGQAAAHGDGNCKLRLARPYMVWDSTPDGPDDGQHWDIRARLRWDCGGHSHAQTTVVLNLQRKQSDGSWKVIERKSKDVTERIDPIVIHTPNHRCSSGTYRARGAGVAWNEKDQVVHAVSGKTGKSSSFNFDICHGTPTYSEAQSERNADSNEDVYTSVNSATTSEMNQIDSWR